MTDGNNEKRRQITISEELEERIVDAYPAAHTPSQAIVMAAQDGVFIRESYSTCFEDRVRSIVADELED